MKINQLLLSSAYPPIRNVVISLSVVNGVSGIKLIQDRRVECNVLWLVSFIDMVVEIPKFDGHCSQNPDREVGADFGDGAGPSRVVASGLLVEFRIRCVYAAPPAFVVLAVCGSRQFLRVNVGG